ncbi:MAG: hypothetical protein IKI21_08540 [Oscillospiraceae bacterium]|nr:hypothetical protein [Oscillospiraceae bacterium]
MKGSCKTRGTRAAFRKAPHGKGGILKRIAAPSIKSVIPDRNAGAFFDR